MRSKWRVIGALVLFFCGSISRAQEVSIGVFGIFHPRNLTLSPCTGESIAISISGKTFVLPTSSKPGIVQISLKDKQLAIEINGKTLHSLELRATSTNSASVNFVLGVPGKITRQYKGTLDVRIVDSTLVPIVRIDLETAVASIVKAESAGNSPLEELKAQAIVTRSYLVAGEGRHPNFDFCDLTHCQFLREPPKREDSASVAADATRGLILLFEARPIAAMFTRSCGGFTRTPAEIGMAPNGYSYFSVRCDACYRNPVRWTRRVSPQDAGVLLTQGEAGRLAVDRRLGWSAVPSDNFSARKVDGEVMLDGVGEGHGVGFCQRGARAMAAAGADFRKIISYYFPSITIGSMPLQSATR